MALVKRLSALITLDIAHVNLGCSAAQVPVEAEDLPDGSPPLSSPHHELFEDWQAARAGLAAGSQPRLAAQGTGGSYFLSNASGRNVAGTPVSGRPPHLYLILLHASAAIPDL